MRSFGLRPRMLAALLLSSVVTLAVAALALLGPLEHRLRADGESVVIQAVIASRPEFSEIHRDPYSHLPDPFELAATTSLLRRRSGAQVTVFDRRLQVLYSPPAFDLDVPQYYAFLRTAFTSAKLRHELLGDDLIVIQPIRIRRERYALLLTKRLQYVASAVGVVQRAFVEAAAVGLAIALLLGVGLTRTLLRRLERLRDSARDLASHGLEAAPPSDTHRDEVGELARTFAAMQSQLQRQENARRSFVATASHELRTPLASLDGMLELLADDLDPANLDLLDARMRIDQARTQSRRLSRLASDLLDLSRLDAEIDLRAEPLELGELARAVIAEFELSALERNVRIAAKPAGEPCWVSGDPGAVARIVRILLDNALRVSPRGSNIDVEVKADESWPQVIVADHGPGVLECERTTIFERFRRGSNAAGQGGFGLGLAIGRELATRMRGTLTLLANTDGHDGARFALRLPATAMNETQPASGQRS